MAITVPPDAVPGAPLMIQVPSAPAVRVGQPAIAVAQPVGAPPQGEEMER